MVLSTWGENAKGSLVMHTKDDQNCQDATSCRVQSMLLKRQDEKRGKQEEEVGKDLVGIYIHNNA